MAPVLLPSLLGSLSRQLTRAVKHAPVDWFTAAGARRCITTITGAAAQVRGSFIPGRLVEMTFRLPLLQNQQLAALQPSAGMKTKSALKKRCKDCFFVRRRGRLFVYCKTHPRHKQRQG